MVVTYNEWPQFLPHTTSKLATGARDSRNKVAEYLHSISILGGRSSFDSAARITLHTVRIHSLVLFYVWWCMSAFCWSSRRNRNIYTDGNRVGDPAR